MSNGPSQKGNNLSNPLLTAQGQGSSTYLMKPTNNLSSEVIGDRSPPDRGRGTLASSVYFIRAGASEHIKIGFCRGDPKRRLAALQTGNPEHLTLLATIRGDQTEERRWHEAFADSRVRGEWFADSPDMIAAVGRAKDGLCWWDAMSPPHAYIMERIDMDPDDEDHENAVAEIVADWREEMSIGALL